MLSCSSSSVVSLFPFFFVSMAYFHAKFNSYILAEYSYRFVSGFLFFFLFCKYFDIVGRVFLNGPGDLSSIPGHVIPKTLKMVLDTSLLKTQHYKVRIKDKVK